MAGERTIEQIRKDADQFLTHEPPAVEVPLPKEPFEVLKEGVSPADAGNIMLDVGKAVGQYGQGVVHGVAKGTYEGMTSAPRLAGTLATMPFQSVPKEAGLWGKVKSAYGQAEAKNPIPAPTLEESIAATKAIASNPLHPLAAEKSYREEFLPEQQGYTESMPKTSVGVGMVATALPGLAELSRTVVTGAGKVAAKSEGLAGFLKRQVMKQGKDVGLPDQVLQIAADNPVKMKEMKKFGTQWLNEKVGTFAGELKDYAKARNEAYESSISPLLKEKGAVPISPDDSKAIRLLISDEIADAGNKRISASYVRTLDDIGRSLDYRPLTFADANEFKQLLYNKFAKFGKVVGEGQMTVDEKTSARTVANALKNAINRAVPEVKPINDAYADASTHLSNMGDLLGKPKMRVTGEGAREKVYPRGEGGFQSSISNTTKGTLLRDFVKANPQSADTVHDIQAYFAAKAIQKGSTPFASAIISPEGARVRGGAPLKMIESLQVKAPIKALEIIQRSKQTPMFSVEGTSRVPWVANIPKAASKEKR